MSTQPNPALEYFQTVSLILSSGAGVPETSFYPALAQLFASLGNTLKPKVTCIINPANRGAGIPDGGFYSADQLRKTPDRLHPPPELMPARGVMEVKPPAHDLQTLLESEQVAQYLRRYGLVLVTNLRAFALVQADPDGNPVVLERCELAPDDKSFRAALAHPHKLAKEQGPILEEYLKRVLTHNAPLKTPQDVARLLSSYAREAKARIENGDLATLTAIKTALESALGLHFEGDKGEHFFRSTLVQTLFYGMFSAWVIHARHRLAVAAHQPSTRAVREAAAAYLPTSDRFDWKDTGFLLRVPMIRALFNLIVHSRDLEQLHLPEVLDWAGAALNRVNARLFFEGFEEHHAVQYFYEPFLAEFDPDLRKELGVWYTPSEIVDYQVQRVDAVLRSELGIPDGLADPHVVVLDPCCGTGAYLCAVLRRIHQTFSDRGADALAAHDLKQAAIQRIFGFEIMPAPFVVAHLQLGLLLESLGAPLDDANTERPGVFLTNSLTGWEPARTPKTKLLFSEMEEERDAADHVKQSHRILVILGNPPYNGFAGMAVSEERALSTAYRETQRAPAPQGQGLNDLYVRFFRMAERRIVELNPPAQGVISFISNYSWLDGLSFTGMRERYLEVFDSLHIDCLNGDKYKTGKLTPDGAPDPSAFSTDFNREGIQVGTAIATLVRKSPAPTAQVHFRHFWGKDKRAALLANQGEYQPISPVLEMGLPFIPGQVAAGYVQWPTLPDLFPVSFPGVKTSRDDFLVDMDPDRLRARLHTYFDPDISHTQMREINPGVMENAARFKGETIRDFLRKRGLLPLNFVRFAYRPFDVRWLYWEPETKLLDEKRSEYFPNVFAGNLWIGAAQQNRKSFDPPLATGHLASLHILERGVNMFPLYLQLDGMSLLESPGQSPNLSGESAAYLARIAAEPADLFFHALAVMHAPAYRAENAGALRQDWPRIPLPQEKSVLLASAALGRQVAALLDTESPVDGVTTGTLRPELRDIALFRRTDGQPADPAAGDLDLTAGWGHAGKGGVTMPGRGKTAPHGTDALDIYLNDSTCWRNVPQAVWEFTIGGYQVIKKWLSYREKPLLGRALTPDEVRYVTEMARRLAALLALHPALDANYRDASKP